MKTLGGMVEGRTVYFVEVGQTVREVARYMTERRVGAVPVLENNRLVGIVSERDIMGRCVARSLDADATRVGEIMTRDLVVAAAAESHEDGLRKMRQAGCRHLPVVVEDRLVGVVSLRDLLQLDLTEKDEEIRWLNAYIHFIPPVREGTS
jgi:CBS domain-containing protein